MRMYTIFIYFLTIVESLDRATAGINILAVVGMSPVLSGASITDRRLYSAIVGFASIIILLPAPGYLATQMQKIQTAKMEKVSDNPTSETFTYFEYMHLY